MNGRRTVQLGKKSLKDHPCPATMKLTGRQRTILQYNSMGHTPGFSGPMPLYSLPDALGWPVWLSDGLGIAQAMLAEMKPEE